MKYPIYRLLNDHVLSEAGGTPIPHFAYVDPTFPPQKKEILEKDASKATLEELVHLCDQEAESCNNHEFCGTHLALAALLLHHVPKKKATEILRHIAELGGLDRMSGVQCDTDAAYDLGITKRKKGSFEDWDGTLNPPK
jgi:hypothetical protein